MCISFRASIAALLSIALFHPASARAADALEGKAPESALCGRIPIDQVEEMDFHLYFPSEKQAIDAAAHVDESTFTVIVRTSAASPEWLLRAIYRELPTATAHSLHSEKLHALARANGGRYDGAGCASHTYRG